MIEIPYATVGQEALLNLLEEIVTRDGTDYGVEEISSDQKVSQALMGLKEGKIKLVFNEQTDTCSVCPIDQWNALKDSVN